MQVEVYIDKAITILKGINIRIKAEPDAPMNKLLDIIPPKYDSNKVLTIGRVLQQQSAFNEVVREQISGMELASRHTEIINAFNSIRKDAEGMASWVSDGKLDFKERLQNMWMTISRGSIPRRFEGIRATYLEVSRDSGDQIKRELAILEAYQSYRFALKQAEIEARHLTEAAEGFLAEAKNKLNAAANAVEGENIEPAELAALELKRDEALMALQKEDKVYQLIKDLCDNLVIAYNAAEVVFARLQQSSAVKERVYQQGVTFFATNEIVFTALAASFNSMLGLSESTKTLDAMKDGMNKSLDTVAKMGNAQMEESLRAGYGSTLKAESVRALVDAIVEFQESSISLIDELRREASSNSHEIEQIVNDGKSRFAKLVSKAN